MNTRSASYIARAALAALVLAAPAAALSAEPPAQHAHGTHDAKVVVYKGPQCDCCGRWADHLRRHGFDVEEVLTDDVAGAKQRLGVPAGLQSCHTAIVGDYVIEGHVPASAVHRLLEEKPDLVGIAVGGMPVGSPGMEGSNPQRYAVHGFDAEGNVTLFSVEEGQAQAQ